MTDEIQASSSQSQEDPAARDRRISLFTSSALRGGASPASIAETLVGRGDFYTLESAHEFISRMIVALQERDVEDQRFVAHRMAKADIYFGALIAFIGVVITVFTASVALGVGIVVAYGAIIVGALMFIRGLLRLMTPNTPK